MIGVTEFFLTIRYIKELLVCWLAIYYKMCKNGSIPQKAGKELWGDHDNYYHSKI